MAAECVRCARPMAEMAYVCPLCATQAAQKLSEVAETTPAARDVAHGLSRRSQSGASGKPGSRLPFDLSATAKLDAVQTCLTRWIDHIGPIRGVPRPWFETNDDPITVGAQWLTQHLEWIRHRAPDADGRWGADEFLTDVDACLRVVRSVARGPAEQRYLGPCGAPYLCDGIAVGDQGQPRAECGALISHEAHELRQCDGDVYGRAGATNGTCRTCGATVDQAERRAWLDDVARQGLYFASEIADAYPININTIRSWVHRGKLATHGERDGRPLLKLGDVLNLAAADAARREENRAKRARRMGQRSGEDAA